MIEFGAPWLLASLLLPLLAVLAVRHAIRAQRANARVLGGPSATMAARSLRRVALSGLLVLAMALAVIAAARPLWGEGEASAAQRGIDLVVLVDVSRSMEAQDIAPSRAQAAASGIQELLTHLVGSRVGLVTFAGSAFTRAPLTHDLEAVASLVARSQGEAPLVRPGTDLQLALDEALDVLDVRDPASARAILLVSDGEDLGSAYEVAVRDAADLGVRIYTVFVGTPGSVPLPEDRGQVDASEGDPDLLAAIASATGGSARTVDRIPGFAVDFRRLQQTTFEEVPQTRPEEQFVWFAAAAAILLAVSVLVGEGGRARMPRLRRGAASVVVSVLSMLLAAGCGSAAWQEVERGHDAFAVGDFEGALTAYRAAAEERPDDPAAAYNVAAALLGIGRYAEARQVADDARRLATEAGDVSTAVAASHVAGNAAFLQQDMEGARDAYEDALRLDPSAADPKANLELVLAILAPPPPPEQPGGGDEPDDDGAGAEGAAGEGAPGAGASDGETPDSPAEPGTPSEGGEGAAGTPGSGTPGSTPAESDAPGAAELMTVEDVNAAIAALLAEIGPELTSEEALQLIELSRRANELQALPGRPGGGQTPR